MGRLKLTILVMSSILIISCSGKIIEENMEYMIGAPATRVFSKLGLPHAENIVAGHKFYIWNTQNQGSYNLPQYHTGTIYTPGGTPSTYTYTTYNQVNYNHFCELRVFVDSLDKITTYDFRGNEGGCRVFASRLSD